MNVDLCVVVGGGIVEMDGLGTICGGMTNGTSEITKSAIACWNFGQGSIFVQEEEKFSQKK